MLKATVTIELVAKELSPQRNAQGNCHHRACRHKAVTTEKCSRQLCRHRTVATEKAQGSCLQREGTGECCHHKAVSIDVLFTDLKCNKFNEMSGQELATCPLNFERLQNKLNEFSFNSSGESNKDGDLRTPIAPHVTSLRMAKVIFLAGTAGFWSYERSDKLVRMSVNTSGEKSETLVRSPVWALFIYIQLFQKSWMAKIFLVSHSTSGSTAAALLAGIPQFYWAKRMFWLGASPEPLKRCDMVPVDGNYTSIKEAAEKLARSISYALSPEVRACALEVAEKLSLEISISDCVTLPSLYGNEE
ncbi:hypothetical protein AgCh_038511 [Apium graveolens]